MNNAKNEFIKYVEELQNYANENVNASEEAIKYWNAFKIESVTEKPRFTENGKLVLTWMREHLDKEMVKSKEIADDLGISSRTVSGAFRKLVNDGYVDKAGQDPVIYMLTEDGKQVDIDNEQE